MATNKNQQSGANLPIPNRERNEGSELEVVPSHWYPQRPRPAVHYSWRRDESFYEPKRQATRHAPQRNICGLKLSTFVLSCAVVFLFAGVFVVAGLLGSKVVNLETTMSSLVTQQARVDSDSTGNKDEQQATKTSTAAMAVKTTRMNKRIAGWNYVGCYEDSGDRILLGDFKQRDDMTNNLCANICVSQEYKYFGTEFYNQCMCGESVARMIPVDDWRCDRKCRGNPVQEVFEPCGGEWFMSLWERH
ncbi:WSC domain-containing protein [Triangularia setosa]|uniref:WSC domain-containing protein n=1 Tax=Triangularia setosa TaxID=2587417 RepID=A0AAN7A3U5_9PEZI|nr:WSC domain-containing protein [Podospora setosa]